MEGAEQVLWTNITAEDKITPHLMMHVSYLAGGWNLKQFIAQLFIYAWDCVGKKRYRVLRSTQRGLGLSWGRVLSPTQGQARWRHWENAGWWSQALHFVQLQTQAQRGAVGPADSRRHDASSHLAMPWSQGQRADLCRS